MNKNPYEVRLEVMKMAQDMLDREQSIKEQKFYSKLESLRSDKFPADYINKFIDESVPTAYTSADITTRANELYAFVSNNKTSDKP